MDLSEVSRFSVLDLDEAFRAGMRTFSAPEPKSLDRWAREHFYLSAESSYVEQKWSPWPFQPGILHLMGSDDVEIFSLRKSARVGYTKMLLADVCYNAQHRRRNQCVWQPTDGDQKDFVQTDLDPVLRDVKVMKSVFPAFMRRHKDNTLDTKRFLGCNLFTRGAKSAQNFRRLTLDVAILDEIDGMDRDIEKEGTPTKLAWKRTEGATFRKLIAGTTPKIRSKSHIEDLENTSDLHLEFRFECPHCHDYHPLTWGGKDEPHGFKWHDDNPDTAAHLCPSCNALVLQSEYTDAAEAGRVRWQSADGIVLHIEDDTPVLRNLDGQRVPFPRRISAFIWTAYSPSVTWPDLVREFLEANEKAKVGDTSLLKTFTNTTLGETWEEEVERTDADQLKQRAEPYRLRNCPAPVLRLYTFVDVQGNRLEAHTWGFGRGCESWVIDRRVFFGNPAEDTIWTELTDYINTPIPSDRGTLLPIHAVAVDEGGHHQHAVRSYVRGLANRRVYATHGRTSREKSINDGSTKVDINWRGRITKNGTKIWWIGTRIAKDLIHGRLAIEKPGPGYIHFSQDLDDEWFAQYTAEKRIDGRWEKDRARNEALDGAVGCIWLAEKDNLSTRGQKWWDELETQAHPPNLDLFSQPPSAAPLHAEQQIYSAPSTPPPADASLFAPIAF